MLAKTNWIDDLIASLEDEENAVRYLTVALEENNQTNQLLSHALENVIESLCQHKNLSSETKECYEKLENLLAQGGNVAIYSLVDLLQRLGFKLVVTLQEKNLNTN